MRGPNGELQEGYESAGPPEILILKLFVIGASPNSIRAIKNVKAICEKYLKDACDLEIIDIYQQPEIAQNEQIIALPLLIKKSPGPERRMIGDLSDESRVLRGLGIKQ